MSYSREYTVEELKSKFSKMGLEYYISKTSGSVVEVRFIVKRDEDI